MFTSFAPETLHLHVYLKGHITKGKKVQVSEYLFRNLIIAQTGYSLRIQQWQWLSEPQNTNCSWRHNAFLLPPTPLDPEQRHERPAPRTCEYATLHGKRKVPDVIKLRILRWEVILNYPGGLNVISRVRVREGDVRTEAEVRDRD